MSRRNTNLNVSLVADRIQKSYGNLSAAADSLGVARQTLYNFIEQHPTLRAVVADSRERMKDAAETSLQTAVMRGESWAVQFYLRTQARDRGYVERKEINLDVVLKREAEAIADKYGLSVEDVLHEAESILAGESD